MIKNWKLYQNWLPHNGKFSRTIQFANYRFVTVPGQWTQLSVVVSVLSPYFDNLLERKICDSVRSVRHGLNLKLHFVGCVEYEIPPTLARY